MSSSYSKGTRIALDFTGEKTEPEFISAIKEKIITECGDDVSLSSHSFCLDSDTWEAVLEHDSFFEKVEVIKKLDDFIKLIKKDRELSGLDVARYILSKIKCTHVKLEKLAYFCFATYLTETEKMLFPDKIYAFERGPVVESIYKEFKYTAGLLPHSLAKESRILFASDGVKKLGCIIKVIEKYGEKNGDDLIEITHKDSSPWDVSYKKGVQFLEIPTETIKANHKFETS